MGVMYDSDKCFQDEIEELQYQEDVRGKGIGYQVSNLVITTAISAMREVRQYRQIGTLDECREARRKQERVEVTDIHADKYYCPACGAENNCDQGIVEDKYCPECGQALMSVNDD